MTTRDNAAATGIPRRLFFLNGGFLNPRLRRILTAEQQIVAGVNVRLTLLLRNGHRWRVTVWRKLDGGMVVTEAVRLG